MTVRLRAHHLLCMLTYVGKGYTAAFTANYDRIVERLNRGEDILLVHGPDDICAPLLCENGAHCFNDSVLQRDERAAQAVSKILARPLRPGDSFRPDAAMLARMRKAFLAGKSRAACKDCEWSALCTSIAVNGFDGARLDLKSA
ncbi:MAG: DUF1284 domain-containing protein [Phyllobacterium sp.]